MIDEDTLVLQPTIGFELHVTQDDRGIGGDYTYYKNQGVALQDAKGKSFFGSDGLVRLVQDLYTDGINLYKVKNIGTFVDQDNEYKLKTIESIKAKLTVEELKLLGL